MCEPTTIALASMAMGAAQSIVGYQAARAQYSSQMDAYKQNAINSSRSTERAYSNLNIKTRQEGEAAAQAQQQNEIERARAVAAAESASYAGGVSGLSVDAVLRDIYAQAGRNEATADTNLRMNRDYLAGEMQSAELTGQSQINGMPIPEKPSATPYLLNTFSSGINAYSTKIMMENN